MANTQPTSLILYFKYVLNSNVIINELTPQSVSEYNDADVSALHSIKKENNNKKNLD